MSPVKDKEVFNRSGSNTGSKSGKGSLQATFETCLQDDSQQDSFNTDLRNGGPGFALGDFDDLVNLKSNRSLEKKLYSPMDNLDSDFWNRFHECVNAYSDRIKSIRFGYISESGVPSSIQSGFENSSGAYHVQFNRTISVMKTDSGLCGKMLRNGQVSFNSGGIELKLSLSGGTLFPINQPCVVILGTSFRSLKNHSDEVICILDLPTNVGFEKLCGLTNSTRDSDKIQLNRFLESQKILRDTAQSLAKESSKRYLQVALGLGNMPSTVYPEEWLERYVTVMTAPASCKSHGSEISGLIEHTSNMLNIARVTSTMYPDIKFDWDLLYLAILFHDLGKWDMYTKTGADDSQWYTLRDRSQDHSISGVAYLGKIHGQVEPSLRMEFQQFNKLCNLIANLHDFSVGKRNGSFTAGASGSGVGSSSSGNSISSSSGLSTSFSVDSNSLSTSSEHISDLLGILRSIDRLESIFSKYRNL